MIESDKPFLIHIIFKRSNVFNLANQEIQEMIERTSDESGSDSDFDESTVLEIETDVDDIESAITKSTMNQKYWIDNQYNLIFRSSRSWLGNYILNLGQTLETSILRGDLFMNHIVETIPKRR